MNTRSTIPTRFAILVHPSLPKAIQESLKVQHYLQDRGLDVMNGMLNDSAYHDQILTSNRDVVIVLGGDGAMLHAGRICAEADIPLLGINFGRFGFLIEIQPNTWRSHVRKLLTGEYYYEERMMLNVEHWRGKNRLSVWQVLNEAVVCRQYQVKPLHLSASVDGIPLTTYVADGLIASTPTGSTAYALAAGGPIMPPELRNILLVPVAPHLSVNQAIILSEGAHVSITVSNDHPAVLSVDGQDPIAMQKSDRVDVYAGEHSVRFIRFQDAGYFYRNLMSHMEQNPATGKHR